jgi:hypothetical protein
MIEVSLALPNRRCVTARGHRSAVRRYEQPVDPAPVGQLAWNKVKEWTHPSTALPGASIDRDEILTTIMLYLLTGTGASSARLSYGDMHAGSRNSGGESGRDLG